MEIITNVQSIDNIIKELQTLKQQFEIMDHELSRLEKKEIELNNMLKTRIKYTRKLEQDLFENARNYVVPKSVIQDKIKQIQNNTENFTFQNLTSEDIRRTIITNLEEILKTKD